MVRKNVVIQLCDIFFAMKKYVNTGGFKVRCSFLNIWIKNKFLYRMSGSHIFMNIGYQQVSVTLNFIFTLGFSLLRKP